MFQNLQIKGLASIKLTRRLIGIIRYHLVAYSETLKHLRWRIFAKSSILDVSQGL